MIIGLLDMDAYFASLEERDSPQFNGLPIVVGSDPRNGKGRGVVSTANYKAREYGIRSGMPINFAWARSEEAKIQGKPGAVFLPPDFFRYEKSSDNIFNIIKKYAEKVEPASIDEFYFDLSFTGSIKKAKKVCQDIKNEIKEMEKITCSIGIGPNKLIAKIAAGMEKPNGLTIVSDKEKERFLAPLGIREIPGIGPKTEEFLNKIGIKIVKDLKKYTKKELEEMMGKHGIDIYYKVRGIGDTEIVENRIVKSIGEQETFLKDTLDSCKILEKFEKMCRHVFGRFEVSGFKGFKTVAIVVRFSGFETKSAAKTFDEEINDYKKMKMEAIKLLLPFLDGRKNPYGKLIRLIGVRVENFVV